MVHPVHPLWYTQVRSCDNPGFGRGTRALPLEVCVYVLGGSLSVFNVSWKVTVGCPRILRCATTSKLLARSRPAAENSYTFSCRGRGGDLCLTGTEKFWCVLVARFGLFQHQSVGLKKRCCRPQALKDLLTARYSSVTGFEQLHTCETADSASPQLTARVITKLEAGGSRAAAASAPWHAASASLCRQVCGRSERLPSRYREFLSFGKKRAQPVQRSQCLSAAARADERHERAHVWFSKGEEDDDAPKAINAA